MKKIALLFFCILPLIFCACDSSDALNNEELSGVITIAPSPEKPREPHKIERPINLQKPSATYSEEELLKLTKNINIIPSEDYTQTLCLTKEDELNFDFVLERIGHNLGEPLSAFVNNGWEINWRDTNGTKTVYPGEEYQVTLFNESKYNQTMSLSTVVINTTKAELPLQECAVFGLSYSTAAFFNKLSSEDAAFVEDVNLQIAGFTWTATQDEICSFLGTPTAISIGAASEDVSCTFTYNNHVLIAVLNNNELLTATLVHSIDQ